MAFQIGQPGVSAFLQSLLRDLDVVIQMGDFLPDIMDLKEMKSLLLGFEDVLLDGERERQLGNKEVERWMDDLKDLLYDIDDLLDEIKMEKQQLQQEITGQPCNTKVRYNFSAGHFTTDNKIRLGQVLDVLHKLTEEANRLKLKRDAVQHDATRLESHDIIIAIVSSFLQSLLRDVDVVIQMDDFIYAYIEMELKEMKRLLLRFECVLDGERKRQHGDKDVKRWMDDLKCSFYDIADLIDEVKIGKQQLQPKITTEPINNQVPYNHSAGFYTSKKIKYRLGQVLDVLRKRTEEANRLELKWDAVQHDATCFESYAMSRPKQCRFADERMIHGREKDKNRIIEMLLAEGGGESKRKRKFEVVCVVGMGGLGKTTLAQLVFQDERVKHFFAVTSWACVSDVVDVNKITQDLIESAAENAELGDGAANMPSGLPALQHRLKKTINDKKFLLVLDDLWTAKELEQLKGPLHFGAKGSKILVTTRLSKVAEDLGNKEPYRLGRLEDAQCLKIFNYNAFGDEGGIDIDKKLMKMGEEIVRKCKGVPLVAKIIGSLLIGAEEGKWKAVQDNDIWNLTYEVEGLHPGLRLSYFYLPPFLKRCLEYFALFPSDYKFDQGDLVRMWMAEGLIQVEEGIKLEEVGNQYYNDLKRRSLIQEDDKIHDMVHHLASIACGSSFFCGSSGFSSRKSSLQSVRHAFFDDKLELLIDSRKLHTLIYKGDLCEELFSCKWLRVLKISSSRHCLPDLPSSLGCDLKHLRYLKLTGEFWKSTLPDLICTLSNLQVLDLSFCWDLTNLPQDVGKLSNLRFLGLDRTDITGLPDSVCCLSNLRDLDLSFCECLTTLPKDVGKLSNLRFLGLDATGITHLPDSVCCLSNLRVLDLSFCRSLRTLPNDLGNLQNLHKLMLDKSSILSLPESVVNATNLRVLEISKHVTLPENIGKLTKLEQFSCYGVGKGKGRGIN